MVNEKQGTSGGDGRRASWSVEFTQIASSGRRLIKGSVSSEDLLKLLTEKLPKRPAHAHLPFNATTFEMICDAISCADKLDDETMAKIETLIENSYEMPKSLVVTNLDLQVFFIGNKERDDFERLFREIDDEVKFYFFKSFRRCRIDFKLSQGATRARIMCDRNTIGKERINCYFAEIYECTGDKHLRPPALEKQFLISPPASPPEGWKPSEENQPVMNFELQAALERLMPGSKHELHPASETQPGIVVHICADDDQEPMQEQFDDQLDEPEEIAIQHRPRVKIQQTACPPSMMKRDDNEPSTSRQ